MTSPLPVTYRLDGLTLNATDAYGCAWYVEKTTGWKGQPKRRTARTPHPTGRGSFRPVAYRAERIIGLSGQTRCPDNLTRVAAVERLEALCGDATRLYDLTVTDQRGQVRVTAVELDDAVQVSLENSERWFQWTMQLAAPDPRKHDGSWQSPTSGLPATATGGLDPAPGLDPAVGLDFGQVGPATVAGVLNAGTTVAYPVFTVTGPISSPQVLDTLTGLSVLWAGSLDTGDTLVINCDDFAAQGVPGHGVYVNGSGNRRFNLITPNGWPVVPAGGNAAYTLIGTGGGAQLTAQLRSAWH